MRPSHAAALCLLVTCTFSQASLGVVSSKTHQADLEKLGLELRML